MLVFAHDVIGHDIINIKKFLEILRYFFQFLATPLLYISSIFTNTTMSFMKSITNFAIL